MHNYIKIAELDNEFEAQLLEAALTERHIPFVMKSYYDSAYDGLFQKQKGWGAVFSHAEHGKEILECLEEIKN